MLVVSAVLLVPVPQDTGAADPIFLHLICLDPSDKVQTSAARTQCDLVAEGKGFQHGVLRPRNANDPDSERFCPIGGRKYVCEGVGLSLTGQFCRRIAGIPCPEGLLCVDDPRDDCAVSSPLGRPR